MFSRCNDVKNKSYRIYGGRGIKVCRRWHDYENFFEDMGEPKAGFSIERIDNNKGYNPKNCKWATKLEQAQNRRTTKLIPYNGKNKSLSEWSRILGIPRGTLDGRIRRGWKIKEAFKAQSKV